MSSPVASNADLYHLALQFREALSVAKNLHVQCAGRDQRHARLLRAWTDMGVIVKKTWKRCSRLAMC
jgi:hypothetical protein